ncbi:Cysteine/O-acetylserine efflux protein [Vibrio aerogenes CECT 7868]|uniref:Cysteine/O-acetylserine efflux protein n=1 Tax=Vibrio aerogenes CECT 7868 TaxID=1216006 RepID=A0A1M5ZF16_9VIBR|nr:LysE family translocator [Vibrio aerogenes]SHI22523.1 Cysteine/O-acetylserine efflux protein [Vibrio aerogenes CECT 7868]
MPEYFTPLFLFAFVATFTPGPNNTMLMTSGVHAGFFRSMPHMLGVAIGFSVMLMLVGLGMTGIFNTLPWLHQSLNILCMAYLCYLAYRIATSRPHIEQADYQPMTFFSAAMFQWVNPKGWTMALTAISLYNPSASWDGLGWITAAFFIATLPSVAAWVLAGKQIRRLLKSPGHMTCFNYVMALALLVSVAPMML